MSFRNLSCLPSTGEFVKYAPPQSGSIKTKFESMANRHIFIASQVIHCEPRQEVTGLGQNGRVGDVASNLEFQKWLHHLQMGSDLQ